MPFSYHRTVRFQDTDAAGVVYFANVLSMCHEAYEASLAAAGIDLHTFFSRAEVAVPIIHADVDFFKPMVCGDRLIIHLTARPLPDCVFEIDYRILHADRGTLLSQAHTRHVCIRRDTRSRHPLPTDMNHWCITCDAAPAPTAAPGNG